MRGFHEDRKYSDTFHLAAFLCDDMSFRSHWHTDIELIYLLKGSTEIGINNKRHILTPGEFAFASSGQIHDVNFSQDIHSQTISLIFHPSIIQANWADGISLDGYFFKDGPKLQVKEYLFSIINELEHKDPFYESLCKGLLLCLTSNLQRYHSVQNFEKKNIEINLVKKAIEFIELNFQNEISLEDTAEYVSLNHQYFCKLFKKVTSMNFKDYLNLIRVENFEKLIQESDCSTTKAALDSGFGSIRTFNRVFLKVRGIPPSKWQKLRLHE